MQGYIQAKARKFLELGADRYRRADYFHEPSDTLGAEELALLSRGMGQLIDGSCFDREKA